MLYGLYVSAAGAMANSHRQDVAANNLANVGTVGFKSDLALLQARRTEAQMSGQQHSTTAILEGIGGGTYAQKNHISFKQGSLQHTDSNYDLALSGQGFFQIKQGDQTLYTRDGRFTTNQENELVTVSGNYPVMDINNRPVIIDPSGKFEIDKAGGVSQYTEMITQLSVVDFKDRSVLKKQGENMFSVQGDAKPITADPIVSQGYLEESDVNAIDQQVALMKYMQLFQANASMLKIQDKTLEAAVNQIAKI